MTPRAGVLLPGRGHVSHIEKMHYFFKNLLLFFEDGSDKNKKAVLMMCTLIPIVLTGYIAAFLCHSFYLFYDGAVDM